MAKRLLIDGFNLAYRCFFGLPELTRADGFPTNALHGWTKSVWRLQDQVRPVSTHVFFDLGGARDRLEILPEYKAQRAEMPEALSRQVEPLKTLTRIMGLGLVEVEGVESDDLLAAEAVAFARAGDEVFIVSSDKDFAQVVGSGILILLPPPSAAPAVGWRTMDEAGVREKFGVPPAQIADYLALMGDASDNIPGIPGVGPKTAARWLADHGSIEGVIAKAAAGELEPARFRESVAGSADLLRRNLRLTTLQIASRPPPLDPSPAVRLPELLAFLEEMGMRSTQVEARRRYGQAELF